MSTPLTEEYTPAVNGHIVAPVDDLNTEQLERIRVDLLDQIRRIEAQMSDPDRRDADGRRLTGEEYWAWRKRARHAWQNKQREYAEVKRRISEAKRHDGNASRTAIGEPEQLLDELRRLVSRWLAEGVTTLRPSEQELLDRVAARLGKRNPNTIRVAQPGDAA